jgi:hypothetical protein
MAYISQGVLQSSGQGDPESLQPAYRRHCPNMTFCWPVQAILPSYQLNVSDRVVLARRLCMWIIMAARTVEMIMAVIFASNPLTMLVYFLINFIAFFCLAYFLHLIDRRCVEGGSIKCFIQWEEIHFNTFLYIMGVAHLGLFIESFMYYGMVLSDALWGGLWVLIIGVGWIAGWEPENQVGL